MIILTGHVYGSYSGGTHPHDVMADTTSGPYCLNVILAELEGQRVRITIEVLETPDAVPPPRPSRERS